MCETFDSWRKPRGNREFLDRMARLGLVDVLRDSQGRLTPTFKPIRSAVVKSQLDYIFVTEALRKRLQISFTAPAEQVIGTLSDHLPVIADFALRGDG